MSDVRRDILREIINGTGCTTSDLLVGRLYDEHEPSTVRTHLADLVREGIVKEEYGECGSMHYDLED